MLAGGKKWHADLGMSQEVQSVTSVEHSLKLRNF